MDPRIFIPIHQRVRDLRIAIKYSRQKFAKLLGVAPINERDIEKGKIRLNLPTIRRLRLLERAFQEHLDEYYRIRKRFNCIYTWGKEEKVYSLWDGILFKRKMVRYQSSNIRPSRKEDYEALGGDKVFGQTKITAELSTDVSSDDDGNYGTIPPRPDPLHPSSRSKLARNNSVRPRQPVAGPDREE